VTTPAQRGGLTGEAARQAAYALRRELAAIRAGLARAERILDEIAGQTRAAADPCPDDPDRVR
jgi:hypothetical protein